MYVYIYKYIYIYFGISFALYPSIYKSDCVSMQTCVYTSHSLKYHSLQDFSLVRAQAIKSFTKMIQRKLSMK